MWLYTTTYVPANSWDFRRPLLSNLNIGGEIVSLYVSYASDLKRVLNFSILRSINMHFVLIGFSSVTSERNFSNVISSSLPVSLLFSTQLSVTLIWLITFQFFSSDYLLLLFSSDFFRGVWLSFKSKFNFKFLLKYSFLLQTIVPYSNLSRVIIKSVNTFQSPEFMQ